MDQTHQSATYRQLQDALEPGLSRLIATVEALMAIGSGPTAGVPAAKLEEEQT
jgi:hypothetical protein